MDSLVAAESLAPLPVAERQRGLPFSVGDWTRLAARPLGVLLVALGLLLVWRRAVGALESPLPVPALLAAGILFSGLAAAARLPRQVLGGEASARRRFRFAALLPTAALAMLGCALTLPGTSAPGLVALWGLVALEEAWAWGGLVRKQGPRSAGSAPAEPDAAAVTEPAVPLPVPPATPDAASLPDDDVLQQFTRSRDASGAERLAGWLRVGFAPGQRTESVHVAFCPPFERTPHLNVEQSAGPAVRVKTAQLLPYGARLDLKLGATAGEFEWVLLEFTATSAAADAARTVEVEV